MYFPSWHQARSVSGFIACHCVGVMICAVTKDAPDVEIPFKPSGQAYKTRPSTDTIERALMQACCNSILVLVIADGVTPLHRYGEPVVPTTRAAPVAAMATISC